MLRVFNARLAVGAGCCYRVAMTVYVFRSKKDPQWFAYANDRRGASLLPDLAPWRAWGGRAIRPEVSKVATERERIARVIEADGYYLFRGPPDP
jgi:hypothetical protein